MSGGIDTGYGTHHHPMRRATDGQTFSCPECERKQRKIARLKEQLTFADEGLTCAHMHGVEVGKDAVREQMAKRIGELEAETTKLKAQLLRADRLVDNLERESCGLRQSLGMNDLAGTAIEKDNAVLRKLVGEIVEVLACVQSWMEYAGKQNLSESATAVVWAFFYRMSGLSGILDLLDRARKEVEDE